MSKHNSLLSHSIVEIFIEIKKDSNLKYEFDKVKRQIKLDRILYGANFYPGDYGFIDRTLELDGDPIDVLIFSEYSTFPGCLATVRIVGGLEMVDAGEVDNKLIAVYVGDPATAHINNIDQINEHWKSKVWDFFLNYKNLEKKKVVIKKWLDCEKACQLRIECEKRFQQSLTTKD